LRRFPAGSGAGKQALTAPPNSADLPAFGIVFAVFSPRFPGLN